MPSSKNHHAAHRVFRAIWWLNNFLLILALAATFCACVWEYSVREYLRGFSDAIIPEASTPIDKVEAILGWMRSGPPRFEVTQPSHVLFTRSPGHSDITGNYLRFAAAPQMLSSIFPAVQAFKCAGCFYYLQIAVPNM